VQADLPCCVGQGSKVATRAVAGLGRYQPLGLKINGPVGGTSRAVPSKATRNPCSRPAPSLPNYFIETTVMSVVGGKRTHARIKKEAAGENPSRFLNRTEKLSYAVCTWPSKDLRRRIPRPIAPNPSSIIAQVAGSGTAAARLTLSSAGP
jgi:hypothetical protein